jgi:hypothetical protein
MSFASKLSKISTENANASEKKRETHEEKMKAVKHEKFVSLTTLYHDKVKRAVENAAKKGNNTKYMNFNKDDFKPNCYGLGYPVEFLRMWLNEMCNPESEYLPTNKETGEKESFEGLKFEAWNNGAFTVKFSW